MKWIIYQPADGEEIPNGSVAYDLDMPRPDVNGNVPNHTEFLVVAAVAPDSFATSGTVIFLASDLGGKITYTKPMTSHQLIHMFSGWYETPVLSHPNET